MLEFCVGPLADRAAEQSRSIGFQPVQRMAMVFSVQKTFGKSRRMGFPDNDSDCGANRHPLHRLEVHATARGWLRRFSVSVDAKSAG